MGHVFITQTHKNDVKLGNIIACDAHIFPYDQLVSSFFTDKENDSNLQFVYKQLGISSGAEINKLKNPPKLEKLNRYYMELKLPTDIAEKTPKVYLLAAFNKANKNQTIISSTDIMENLLSHIINQWKVENKKKFNNRAKYLISLPFINNRGSGYFDITSEVIASTVDCLLNLANQNEDFDFLITTTDSKSYTMAQRYRLEKLNLFWENCSDFIKNEIENENGNIIRLAKLAAENKLVVFIGAGVSIGAGMPSWAGLLQELAEGCNINTNDNNWNSLDYLSKAELIEKRMLLKQQSGLSDETLGSWIAKRMDLPYYSLQHSLLSLLKPSGVVTTNYDRCFEMASIDTLNVILSSSIKHHSKVVKTESAILSSKWLLKMHGCISEPNNIVLTRSHYLRYMEKNAALAGIVQANLLTSHMLFVGFSLDDDNFHKIMDSVRKAKRFNKNKQTVMDIHDYSATSIQLYENIYVKAIWEPAILPISMRSDDPSLPKDWSGAGRDVELYLDLLALSASKFACNYILDERYKLSSDEMALADALKQLQDALPSNFVHEPPFKSLFTRYGAHIHNAYYRDRKTNRLDHI